jgi:endonuclease YncB( thermonuclease family)
MLKRLLVIFVLYFLLLPSCSDWSGKDGNTAENPVVAEARQSGKLLTGKVVGISDGDTFKLLIEGNKTVRVRLFGIDAPEKGQDFGTQARQELSNLVFSKPVDVVQKTKDRYGRVVAIVFIAGANVNEQLLRNGMVWHYTEYDKNPVWARFQEEAKQSRRGLWSQPNPTPPWQWRRERREVQEADVGNTD